MQNSQFQVEICIDTIESAIEAAAGGAQRLEVCAALSEGGLTPSAGMLKVLKTVLPPDSPKCYCMIRPRRGDFLYSADEIVSMCEDIHILSELGADGFVFGCLTSLGTLNKDFCRRLIEAANPLPCTLHRAFDVSRDAIQTTADAIEVGFTCILTSGQAPSAEAGVELIKTIQQKFGDQISVLPGVGVSESNAKFIIAKTGVNQLHSSASVPRTSAMEYRNPKCQMSSNEIDEYSWKKTDSEKVRQILNAANKSA